MSRILDLRRLTDVVRLESDVDGFWLFQCCLGGRFEILSGLGIGFSRGRPMAGWACSFSVIVMMFCPLYRYFLEAGRRRGGNRARMYSVLYMDLLAVIFLIRQSHGSPTTRLSITTSEKKMRKFVSGLRSTQPSVAMNEVEKSALPIL